MLMACVQVRGILKKSNQDRIVVPVHAGLEQHSARRRVLFKHTQAQAAGQQQLRNPGLQPPIAYCGVFDGHGKCSVLALHSTLDRYPSFGENVSSQVRSH